jgi:hypothetical protein
MRGLSNLLILFVSVPTGRRFVGPLTARSLTRPGNRRRCDGNCHGRVNN